RLCSFEGDVEISNTSFEVGEEVEIMAGHFIGFTGTLINVENKDKLKIRFSDLNCFATVENRKKILQKVWNFKKRFINLLLYPMILRLSKQKCY
ncbi:MAG: hypothetical protein JJT94_08330, partial [Bernardetiaceae bacterium]|nr:hypothetical protein [Bernardetiaceae bacterium]